MAGVLKSDGTKIVRQGYVVRSC